MRKLIRLALISSFFCFSFKGFSAHEDAGLPQYGELPPAYDPAGAKEALEAVDREREEQDRQRKRNQLHDHVRNCVEGVERQELLCLALDANDIVSPFSFCDTAQPQLEAMGFSLKQINFIRRVMAQAPLIPPQGPRQEEGFPDVEKGDSKLSAFLDSIGLRDLVPTLIANKVTSMELLIQAARDPSFFRHTCKFSENHVKFLERGLHNGNANAMKDDEELTKFLDNLGLATIKPQLIGRGFTSMKQLQSASQSDLNKIGLKPAHKRALLEALGK